MRLVAHTFGLLLLWLLRRASGALRTFVDLLLRALGVGVLDESQILLNALHFFYEASFLLQLLLSLHELLLLRSQLLSEVLVL